MQITARQYGARMRTAGIKWPAPAIGRSDLLQAGVTVYQIGARYPSNCLVVARQGWGTVYCTRAYTGYRAAFDQAMPGLSTGREVDHLHPKSRAMVGDYVAMGRISRASNNTWRADDSAQALAQKVLQMSRVRPHDFTSFLTDMERGWAAVSHFIRPITEMSALRAMSADEIKAIFA